MFTLIFWFGFTNPTPVVVDNIVSRQECAHLAASIEASRRQQLNELEKITHTHSAIQPQFTFTCEERKK